ncbi:MAG: RNA polymerase sigma factor [Rhodobacteraceae bacterium]|nr:RNA polymerase sigma factor [Paracoccaceae bacterium]
MRSKDKIYEEFLAASARLGDRKSLESLIKYRGPRLFAHAYRLLGNREEAADVVQDAWVEITRGLPNLREPRAFSAWAYRIVSRRCAKMIAQNIKHRRISETVDISTVPEGNPVEQASDTQAVRAAINQLTLDQAATIRLFYLEDFSVAEAALALDIPVGTVKTRLMHARKILKTYLKGDYDV